MPRIVRRVMSRLSQGAVAALLATAPLCAQAAAPAPYTDWAFDLKRAAEDTAAWATLAQKAPNFARIWFYGQVFDLSTVGVTEEVRNFLRPRLETIARVLGEATPPDKMPALLLDRARNGSLEEFSRRARQVEDDLLQSARGGNVEAANIAAAAHPDQARIVFYRLLARAESTRGRLGGEREAALLVDLARRIADGYALAVDDLSLWSTVAAWQGGTGVGVGKELVVDLQVAGGLNAALAGDMPGARKRLEEALSTARASRGTTFYTVLILNGTANMAARAGDAAAAQAIRHQVVAQIRPMNDPSLQALLADQLVKTYIVERNWTEVALYTRELRGLGPAILQAPDYLNNLAVAAKVLSTTADTEVAAGRLGAAVPLLQEAGQIWALLKPREVVGVTEPSDRVESVRIERERATASVQRALGRIDERRGRFAEARAAFEQARVILEAAGLTDDQGATETELSRVELAAGDLDAALAQANAAVTRLTYGDAELFSRAHRQRGWVRLRRGESAAAFDNANAGLAVLKAQNDPARFVVERAALHRLAAVALDAGGFPEAARERLKFARGVHPSAETALLLAQTAFEAGDPAGVDAAFADVPDAVLDPRIRAVVRGCAQARAGQNEAATTSLAQVNTLVSPALRLYQLVGRTCLASVQLASGQAQAAANTILPARALAAEFADPGLSWRVAALEGEASAALGQTPQAATAWRQAVDHFVEILGERPDRGAPLDTRLPALPATPEKVLAGLPIALSDTAVAGKPADAAINFGAALGHAAFAQQFHASPPLVAGALLDRRPASELVVRAALAHAIAQRAPLRDAAVEGSDRGPAMSAALAATKRLRDARQAAVDAAPAYWGYVAPTLPGVAALQPAEGEARVYYTTGETTGRVWLWVHGDAAPRVWSLPGRKALADALSPALAAVLHPPVAWPAKSRPGTRDPNARDWEALTKATPVALPFLKDKAIAGKLAGKRLRIYADGPLLRFPLEALIVAPAPRGPGKAPVFLGARYPVERGLLPGLPASTRDAEPDKAWSIVGPLAATGGCPPVAFTALKGLYEPCTGTDAGPEVEVARGAFAAAADKLVAWGGTEANALSLGLALGQGRVTQLATPVDAETGDLLLSAPDGAAPTRSTPFALALLPARADTVLATRLTVPPLDAETGDGLRRFAAALRFAGVPRLDVLAWRNGATVDAETIASLSAAVAGGTTFDAAVTAERQGAQGAGLDPKVGGVPGYHPWFWARWLPFTR